VLIFMCVVVSTACWKERNESNVDHDCMYMNDGICN